MPLWPAGLLYLQALAEPASRVPACAPRNETEAQGTDLGMADLLRLPREGWRKNSQW